MNQVAQNQKVDNRSASQKIADLENGLIALYGTADNMARDLMTIKEILKVLDNKVNSIIKASSLGQAINDEVVSKIMVDNSVEELKGRVSMLVAQGKLKSSEQVSLQSFVAGSVENESGAVVNPRFQFAVQAMNKEVQEKTVGAKVGDSLKILEEQNLSFKVLEVYDIQLESQAEQAPQQEQAQSPQA